MTHELETEEYEMKNKGKAKRAKVDHLPERGTGDEPDEGAMAKFKRKDYDKKLAKLHVELVKLQEWVRHEGRKVCVIFEGRDGAGKRTSRPSPPGVHCVFKVVALTAPTSGPRKCLSAVPPYPAGGGR